MNSENVSNEATSVTTSTNAPDDSGQAGKSSNGKPETASSESDYLTRQAEEALEALKKTLAVAKDDLMAGANPVGWVKEHPWITLGATAAAGFVAAAMLVPSKEDQALKRLAKIERALNPRREHADGHSSSSEPHPKESGMMGLIGREAIKAVQPMLTALVSGGMAAMSAKLQTQEHKEEEPGNGNSDEPSHAAAQ